MKKIIILGAGATGLGSGYRLYELGYNNWCIYEKNDYVGGLGASFKDEYGFIWDIGGHIIFSNYDRFNLLVDNLLGDEILTFTRESWIWIKEHFIRYPFQNNFHLHPDKEMVLECLLGLYDNHRNMGSYKNFEDWVYHIFGEGVAKHFMVPYNRKVWACPLNRMDYNWIAERVSIIDVKKILKNIVYRWDDGDWGPNNTFRFPLFGGTGGLFKKFLPYVNGHLALNKKAVKILPESKEIIFHDGEKASYDVLISTIPLNEFLDKLERKPETLEKHANKFLWTSGYMVGIGIKKPCPSDKNWMYFPQNDSPFYRVTYLSNYSPNMTPKGNYFSFLAETSFSDSKTISRETIIENTIQGLINSNLLKEQDRSLIVSKYIIEVPYSLPVPFLGRNKALRDIQLFLTKHNIYSRGRFGGWKYELGNMDHSVLQGMEVVDRILSNKEEQLYRT
ncbi:MAG: protoporphyrinogen/coproporphyrinogen oxidase [Candidatus Hodarchaeota archaeon]